MARGAHKVPTFDNEVLTLLRVSDDFWTCCALRDYFNQGKTAHAEQVTWDKMHQSLRDLSKYKCVDSIVQGDVRFWFALPPEQDTRHFVCLERAPWQSRKPRIVKVKPHGTAKTQAA